MLASRLAYLFNSYMQQQCTIAEEEELMAFLADHENKEAVHALIEQVISSSGEEIVMPGHKAASVISHILQQDRSGVVAMRKKKSIPFLRMQMAAAAVIFCIAMAAYWYSGKPEKEFVEMAEKPATILPGGNRAILTVADGSTIVLDSMQSEMLIQQGSTNIKKKGTSLVYNATASVNMEEAVFNTLSTPRGGQYHLVLPDGSKVWLNASSSLHYPIVFTGSMREVELTGEAYFEIAKNKEKPFRVNVSGMKVEVLGTHFNINAYKDEDAVRTSLLEGKIKVVKDEFADVLQPGQQAILAATYKKFKKINVDMDDVVAWKNGLFQFNGDDITSIMRQINRWYDVEVAYSAKIPVRRFEGKISRGAPLSDVLKILELSGVKFKVEEKRIIVQ